MLTLADIDLTGKVAIVRADLNVPLNEDGTVAEDTRIQASLPTFRTVLEKGKGLVILSHLGRPTEGEFDAKKSLARVAESVAQQLGRPVQLKTLDEATYPADGEVVMLENTRFNKGEKANDAELAQRYAACGDVFVMDAFASSHRSEASTSALARAAKERCAGLLLQAEFEALEKAVSNPKSPVLAIVGGAKVSTKLTVLDNLAALADEVIVGGGIANTFLQAQGHEIGKSLTESSMTDVCSDLLQKHPGKFYLPADVVVAKSLDDATGAVKPVDSVAADDLILDAGPQAIEDIVKRVESSATVIWNGALGVFEKEAFSAGTKALALALGSASAFSLAGGGETVAAAKLYKVADQLSYLSTGGGAFLEFIEGKALPGVQALARS